MITSSIKKIILFGGILLLMVYLYRYTPRRIEFLGHYDKVMAHRANSLEKLDLALHFFNGVELDLDYKADTNILDVNHLPAESINLSFETYVNHIKEDNLPFLWLDIKDLNTSNCNNILIKLNDIFRNKNYPKDKVLIETQHPEALAKFIQEGYNTSYYITPQLFKKNQNDINKALNNIKSILDKNPEMAISTSLNGHAFISAKFPNKKKYIWSDGSVFKIKYKKTRAVLNDKTVKKVLVIFNTFNGER